MTRPCSLLVALTEDLGLCPALGTTWDPILPALRPGRCVHKDGECLSFLIDILQINVRQQKGAQAQLFAKAFVIKILLHRNR